MKPGDLLCRLKSGPNANKVATLVALHDRYAVIRLPNESTTREVPIQCVEMLRTQSGLARV